MGSTFAARRAGMQQAIAAVILVKRYDWPFRSDLAFPSVIASS
jgi:hypothetical protein